MSLAYFGGKDYSIVSHSVSQTRTPELTSIQYPDGHIIVIGYLGNRIDLPGSRIMNYIDIKYLNRYVYKFDLKTSYFIRNRYGIPISDFQIKSARLCLLSVTRTGPDLLGTENPYTFDYYTGSDDPDDFVPPPFFYAKDIWGYYNGSESKKYSNSEPVSLAHDVSDLSNDEIRGLCFNSPARILNSKPGYAKNGLLRQIVFPTGSVLQYEYSQNKFDFGDGLIDAAGVHVSKTLVSDGGFSNSCESPLVTYYSYEESDESPSLWGLEMPLNTITAKQRYVPEHKIGKWKPLFSATCDYKYKYPGILTKSQQVSLTSAEKLMTTLSGIMNVVSSVTTAIDIISISMHATPLAIIAVVVDVISLVIDLVQCFGSAPVTDESVIVYSNSNIRAQNPLPNQFRRVVITESSGQRGKTIMEFTSPYDDDGEPIWVPNNDIQSMEQRFAFWAYGLPKKTTVENVSGQVIKETENFYDYIQIGYGDIKYLDSDYLSCKCKVEKSFSIRDVDWSNSDFYDAPGAYVKTNNAGDNLRAKLYYFYTGRAILTETVGKDYKPDGSSAYLSTRTTYTYSPNNYQANWISSTLSNGDIEYQHITYSADYNTGILQTLNTHNVLNTQVANAYFIEKSGDPTMRLIGETVAEYGTLSNGGIKQTRTMEQRLGSPISPYTTYQGPGHSGNPSYVQTQAFAYNTNSELAGVTDEGGRSISNIFDYDGKYIVASTINANPATDKIAYSGFETLSLGGWSLSGSDAYNPSIYITGNSGFTLSSSNSLSAPLTSGKAHTVSFWANNASVSASGGTLVKTGPTISGMTYYEFRVSQGPGTVVVTGNATIDELRSYPETARMRTITYEPLLGKTAESDENNRINYYTYDNTGKLQFIKDEYGNIIKMFEYNVAAYKPNGCTPSYTNRSVSEIFTKQTCGSNFIGGSVTYSVPAGKYTSSVSQAMADMEAEIELEQLGQNYANANGACIPIYWNDSQTESFVKQNCDPGEAGNTMNYSVPADTYYSTISKTDANNMALAEILSNGQAYVNENGSCTPSTEPVWESDGDPQFRCQKDAYNYNTGRQEILVRDINPNSATYNQVAWKPGDFSTSCPEPPYKLIRQTSPCSGVTTNHTLTAPIGSVVVVKVVLQGMARWDGLNNGMGGKVTLSGGGQNCSSSSPHYTNSSDVNLNEECSITFTTISATTALVSEAIVYNSAISNGGIATLELVSVDGNPVNDQTSSCAGDISFYW